MRRTVGPLRGLGDPAAMILTVDPLRSGAVRSSRARGLNDREAHFRTPSIYFPSQFLDLTACSDI
jgi:hypothetical protein